MSTLTELQQVNLAKMAATDKAQSEPAAFTEMRQAADTEVRTDASTGLRPPASEQGREAVSAPVSTDGRTQGRAGGSTEGSADAGPSVRKPVRPPANADGDKEKGKEAPPADAFLGAVEAALASREPLMGGVKATVDMSPELSTRAKRYLADHRGQSTRQVLIALFDAFLTQKGY